MGCQMPECPQVSHAEIKVDMDQVELLCLMLGQLVF